ncbi:MAG: hypothetical protein QF682_05150 [Candidatus Thermoplasmatota archaeon]|jgi:hypothetical protein|nr:hypothetical protein [Candidatus Thermoplasmatota archaeon]
MNKKSRYYIVIISLFFCIITGSIIGSGVVSEESRNPTEEKEYFEITGVVIPANSTMVTCCIASDAEINNLTGEFHIPGLKNGEYFYAIHYEGYESHFLTIVVNGSNDDLGVIELSREGAPIITHKVNIGPWNNGAGHGIPGINVSFIFNDKEYWDITDENGNTSFYLPVKDITDKTEITAVYQKSLIKWKWNADKIPLDAFAQGESSDSSFQISIIAILIIIIFVTIIVFFIMKKRMSLN